MDASNTCMDASTSSMEASIYFHNMRPWKLISTSTKKIRFEVVEASVKVIRVCSVRYTGTRGIFGGHTELTELAEVTGTGIESHRILRKCQVPVLSSCQIMPECLAGY